MSDTWRIVVVLLAAGFIIEAVFLVAVMRQVGLVVLQREPMRAVDVQPGPPLGMLKSLPGVESTKRPALVLFTSSACPHCKALTPRLRQLYADYGPQAHHGHQLDLVAVVTDQNSPSRSEYARELGSFARTDLIALMQDWDIPGTPFAVALDTEHRVQAADVVNTPEQLQTRLSGVS